MKIHPLTFCLVGAMIFAASAGAFNHIDPWLGVLMYAVSVICIAYGANKFFTNKKH